MEIVRKEYSFKSATGLCDIYARSWAPADKDSVKAIFQITHGMAEHGERYARFAKKLCEHGYAVFAQDHIGHGKSVASDDDLGYFGEKDGWRDFVIAALLPISPARSIPASPSYSSVTAWARSSQETIPLNITMFRRLSSAAQAERIPPHLSP